VYAIISCACEHLHAANDVSVCQHTHVGVLACSNNYMFPVVCILICSCAWTVSIGTAWRYIAEADIFKRLRHQ